jgi:hypothetical protein
MADTKNGMADIKMIGHTSTRRLAAQISCADVPAHTSLVLLLLTTAIMSSTKLFCAISIFN